MKDQKNHILQPVVSANDIVTPKSSPDSQSKKLSLRSFSPSPSKSPISTMSRVQQEEHIRRQVAREAPQLMGKTKKFGRIVTTMLVRVGKVPEESVPQIDEDSVLNLDDHGTENVNFSPLPQQHHNRVRDSKVRQKRNSLQHRKFIITDCSEESDGNAQDETSSTVEGWTDRMQRVWRDTDMEGRTTKKWQKRGSSKKSVSKGDPKLDIDSLLKEKAVGDEDIKGRLGYDSGMDHEAITAWRKVDDRVNGDEVVDDMKLSRELRFVDADTSHSRQNGDLERDGKMPTLDSTLVRQIMQEVRQRMQSRTLPETLIPHEYHITRWTPVVNRKEIDSGDLKYDAETGIWELKVFPSSQPAGREQARYLADVFEKMMEQTAKDTATKDEIRRCLAEVETISIVARELVRQVQMQCTTRGVLLEQVFSHLYERNVLLGRASQRSVRMVQEMMKQLKDANDKLEHMKSENVVLSKQIYERDKNFDALRRTRDDLQISLDKMTHSKKSVRNNETQTEEKLVKEYAVSEPHKPQQDSSSPKLQTQDKKHDGRRRKSRRSDQTTSVIVYRSINKIGLDYFSSGQEGSLHGSSSVNSDMMVNPLDALIEHEQQLMKRIHPEGDQNENGPEIDWNEDDRSSLDEDIPEGSESHTNMEQNGNEISDNAAAVKVSRHITIQEQQTQTENDEIEILHREYKEREQALLKEIDDLRIRVREMEENEKVIKIQKEEAVVPNPVDDQSNPVSTGYFEAKPTNIPRGSKKMRKSKKLSTERLPVTSQEQATTPSTGSDVDANDTVSGISHMKKAASSSSSPTAISAWPALDFSHSSNDVDRENDNIPVTLTVTIPQCTNETGMKRNDGNLIPEKSSGDVYLSVPKSKTVKSARKSKSPSRRGSVSSSNALRNKDVNEADSVDSKNNNLMNNERRRLLSQIGDSTVVKIVSRMLGQSLDSENSGDVPLTKPSTKKLRALSTDQIVEIFKVLLNSDQEIGARPLRGERWVNKIILDICLDLERNPSAQRRILSREQLVHQIYDWFLLKYGLGIIAMSYLEDFLFSLKQCISSSARVNAFCQFTGLCEHLGIEQETMYNADSFDVYVRMLSITKAMLNKRALRELEDGNLVLSLLFVNILLDRLRIWGDQGIPDEVVERLNAVVRRGFASLEDVAHVLIETHHVAHTKKDDIQTQLMKYPDKNQTLNSVITFGDSAAAAAGHPSQR